VVKTVLFDILRIFSVVGREKNKQRKEWKYGNVGKLRIYPNLDIGNQRGSTWQCGY
jgi:hypothetical protein